MPAPKQLDPEAGAAARFGYELRMARENAGLTQAQLGQKSGYHPNAIGMFERAERRVKAEFADHLQDPRPVAGDRSRRTRAVDVGTDHGPRAPPDARLHAGHRGGQTRRHRGGDRDGGPGSDGTQGDLPQSQPAHPVRGAGRVDPAPSDRRRECHPRPARVPDRGGPPPHHHPDPSLQRPGDRRLAGRMPDRAFGHRTHRGLHRQPGCREGMGRRIRDRNPRSPLPDVPLRSSPPKCFDPQD
ncbi:helix-turn-helix transcriptional regulator [Nonomuraea sp. MG754425]|nr:helix-turn-helix transcriptional regulator [Nonomuraea sp. MG754425]